MVAPHAVTAGRKSGQSGLNTVLFWAVSAILVLAPIPLGSNRPLPWGLWSACIGFVGFIYLLLIFLRSERLRTPMSHIAIPATLMGLTLAYLVVQLLPIPSHIDLGSGILLQISQISITPNMTLLMLTRQLTFGLLFFLTLQICVNDARRSRLLHVLLVSIVLYGLYGEVALQTGDTLLGAAKWAYEGAATGTFVNRNSFATFLAFGAMLALAQIGGLVMRQSERHRDDGRVSGTVGRVTIYGLCYVFLLVIIVATQSRMGLVSAGVGSLVILGLMAVQIGSRRVMTYAVPLLLIALVCGALLFGTTLFNRVEMLDATNDVRFSLYAETLELIARRPWLGFGGGSFEMAFPLVHTEAVDTNYFWDHAHNTYLTLWSELGLVFGSLPMLALLYVAYRLLRGFFGRTGSFTGQLSALGVLTVGAVHSIFDFSLEIQADTFVFIAVIAAGFAPLASRIPGRTY